MKLILFVSRSGLAGTRMCWAKVTGMTNQCCSSCLCMKANLKYVRSTSLH